MGIFHSLFSITSCLGLKLNTIRRRGPFISHPYIQNPCFCLYFSVQLQAKKKYFCVSTMPGQYSWAIVFAFPHGPIIIISIKLLTHLLLFCWYLLICQLYLHIFISWYFILTINTSNISKLRNIDISTYLLILHISQVQLYINILSSLLILQIFLSSVISWYILLSMNTSDISKLIYILISQLIY